MDTRGTVIVLVGPKGAGAKRVLAEVGGVIVERYAWRAFEEIARAVRQAAQAARMVIIKLVRVRASARTCVERMLARAPSRQAEMSGEFVDDDPPLSRKQVALAFAGWVAS